MLHDLKAGVVLSHKPPAPKQSNATLKFGNDDILWYEVPFTEPLTPEALRHLDLTQSKSHQTAV